MKALNDEDFYIHRLGFEAVRASFDKVGKADLMLVINAMKINSPGVARDGAGDKITAWREYAAPANVADHCRVLKEFSTKRTLALLNQQLVNRTHDKDDEKVQFLEETATKLRENSLVSNDTYSALLTELRRVCAGELLDLGFPGCGIIARTCCMTPGSVTVLCGDPGASKSFFVMELLWKWCLAGQRIASLNLEKNSPFHGRRIQAQIANCEGITRNNWCLENAPIVDQVISYCDSAMMRLYSEQVFQTRNNQIPTRTFIIRWIRREIARGTRIIVIDPITYMTPETRMRHLDEERMFSEIGDLVANNPISIILVTHPKNGLAGVKIRPAKENIAGSASFSRFTDSVFWLESHEDKNEVLTDTATISPGSPSTFNRTIHVLKTKLGPGEGQRIAFKFHQSSLTHSELGILPRDEE